MMKTNEVNIRDPFVLLHGGKYYLYGTRSATCWGSAEGFDCYVSEDHFPNDRYQEYPIFVDVLLDGNGLKLKKRDDFKAPGAAGRRTGGRIGQ